MITARRAMINAGAGKTKWRVLIARAGQSKLDTFESHMTSFATLNAEFCSLTTALIIIVWPSLSYLATTQFYFYFQFNPGGI
jgi:hypothetical protein